MDSEYSQAQLQRPVYGEEPQQGLDSATTQGGEGKTKKPVLKKVKDKVKGPVKKIKHTISRKSKNHGDQQSQGAGQGDDNLAYEKLSSPDYDESPDPEEEGGYDEEDEEQEVDPEVHGGDGGLRDTIAGARDTDDQRGSEHREAEKTGFGLGDYKGNFHEDPAAPGSVARTQDNQQGSFPPTAGKEIDANPSLTQSFERMAVSNEPGHDKQTQRDESLPTSRDALPRREDQDQQKSLDSFTDYPGSENRTQQDESLPTSQDAVQKGSHDDFSPEPMKEDQQKSFDSVNAEQPQEHGESTPIAASQEDATSRELPTQEHNPSESSLNQDSKNKSYTAKVGAAAAGLGSAIYGTAANAGTGLKEKVSPSGQQQSGQQLSDESATDQTQQQPSYTQKAYDAVQPAKDRAVGLASAAYNKAAGAGQAAKERTVGATEATKDRAAGATEATKENAAEAQGQAREKAAGAGAAAKEKTAGATEATKEKAAGATEATKEKTAGATQAAKEKAAELQVRARETAAGARDTFAEKTKPGDEEKALSQVISDMVSSRKDTAKEKAGEAADVGAEKAAHAKEKAYEAGNIGAEKAKEQTGVAKEKANELKDRSVEAKDVGTEKAKEKAANAREGTDNNGTPIVEKIKDAVTSLFGTRASADTQAHAAADQQSTQEATEGEKIQGQNA